MNRTSIVALVLFVAGLGYFLSLGAGGTRKLQSSVYQFISPFLSSGAGLQKQITSVRSNLKSLDDLQAENSSLRVENRSLKATNQALRDVEHEVNRLRHAVNYRERAVFNLCRQKSSRAIPPPGGAPLPLIVANRMGSTAICRL